MMGREDCLVLLEEFTAGSQLLVCVCLSERDVVERRLRTRLWRTLLAWLSFRC